MKNADTRERILARMFTDIHKNGFQGLRADKVIADLAITKGALYHYFPSKQDIGVAVVDEIIRPNYLAFYRELDQSAANPIDTLQAHIHRLANNCTPENIGLGCPLNNLMQEMSPIDEVFRLKLKSILDSMHRSVSDALRRGQGAGLVRADIDTQAIAHFYLSALEGTYGIAKVQNNITVLQAAMTVLGSFFDGLRK
jgi:TetR/AcrR family transcriptional regulator, transcriptional repressor for nem operon